MDNIYVTKTYMPPFEEFSHFLKKIWETHVVTIDGPYYKQFEKDLKEYHDFDNIICLANGTIALQIAYKALELKGEVITTPFTYVATSSSLAWENLKPVFVDIDPWTLNMNPANIEAKVNENTTAILPVHVYGNPCDIDTIENIAKKYGLKTIYDAAHAFGSRYKGKPVLTYGDITMTSFNATKALHTIEGGALFFKDGEMESVIKKLGFFGMVDKKVNSRIGTNAKMNEFSAVFGILNLRFFDECTKVRKTGYELYRELLKDNQHIQFQKLTDEINYSYFPVILESEQYKKEILKKLNYKKIFPREYFYPSLEPYFTDSGKIECTIAYDIANRILCLPMSNYLKIEEVEFICEVING